MVTTLFDPYATTVAWPDEDGGGEEGRRLRGFAIAARCRIEKTAIGYLVPSQSGRDPYVVVIDGTHYCSCMNYAVYSGDCKHIYAALFVREREGGPIVPVTIPPAPVTNILPQEKLDTMTYAYRRDLAKTTEVDNVQRMLKDICSYLVQPPRGRGRPRNLVSDMAYSVVMKVFRGLSSRRYDCDSRAAYQSGQISDKPHYNTVLKYMALPSMTPVLQDMIAITAIPVISIERTFSIDSSGFSTSNTVNWHRKKHQHVKDHKHWMKSHILYGNLTHVGVAVAISQGNAHDINYYKPLLEQANQYFNIDEISADKAYLSRPNINHTFNLDITPLIPFKSNSVAHIDDHSPWAQAYHYYHLHQDEFLRRYHERNQSEAGFSMFKRTLEASLLSTSEVGQTNELLALWVAHNLRCLNTALMTFGIEWPFFS